MEASFPYLNNTMTTLPPSHLEHPSDDGDRLAPPRASQTKRPPGVHEYTIGWIAALYFERAAAQVMLDERYPTPLVAASRDDNNYEFGRIGHHNVVIAVLGDEPGTSNAAIVAKDMHRTFPSLGAFFMVGIAGGVPGPGDTSVRLGDIVVGKKVIQYDLGKFEGEDDFNLISTPLKASPVLRNAYAGLRSNHVVAQTRILDIIRGIAEKRPHMKQYSCRETLQDWLFESTYTHRGPEKTCDKCDPSKLVRSDRGREYPMIHYGVIASGNSLIKHVGRRDELAKKHGALCFEMEGSGVIGNFPCLVVRAISDYADSHKNDQWQPYAAATAAAYTKELICQMDALKVEALNAVEQREVENPKKELIESLEFPNMYHRVNDLDSHLTNDQTCRWIIDHRYHQAWLNPNNYDQHKGVLWIRGKPGVGKSTIMRFLSKYLMGDDSRAVISFFFNARGDDLQKSPEGVRRYLLCQLLELPGLHVPAQLCAPYRTSSSRTGWRLDHLRNLFSDVIGIIRQRQLICLIDALDECGGEAHSMLDYFQDLAQLALRKGVKLFMCFSARHYPAISTGPGLTLILENELGHRHDLETYVNSKLDGVGQREDADEIKTALLNKSDGVFLWVFLVVSQLNKDIRGGRSFGWEKRLKEIPGDLHSLFNGILTKDKDDASVLELSIQLILFSKTPLKSEQYYHAMVTESDPDTQPDVSSKEEMEKYVQSSSKGLAEVTSDGFVQFIHESVRDFLTNPTENGGVRVWWRYPESDFRAGSHRRLAIVCRGYIQMWHEEVLSDYIKRDDIEGVDEAFPFIDYALHYVWLHAAIVAPCSSKPDCPDQFEDVWISLYYSLGFADIDEDKLAASLFYLFSGRPSAFRRICWLTQGYNPTLLSVATNGRHAKLMHLLVDCRELRFDGNSWCVNVNEDVYDGTPLLVACSGPEYKGVIEPLLKRGAGVNSTDDHGRTPLLRAASWSHQAVKLLLDYGAEVNVSCGDGQTPLIIAIRFRQKETVRLLLSKGADVNATDNYDESPLLFAARYGYSEILELLLNQKTAEVDKQNSFGETPLLIATAGIELQVLRQLLIDHGASDNSALEIVKKVIEEGDENSVMDLLLEEPDKRWVEHFRLALGFWLGTREARMLGPSYEPDIEHDFREWQYNTERNKEEMVKMLLEHGASVDIAGDDGMTPLKLARVWRNTKIEKLLQDRGATESVVDNEDAMQID